MNQFITKEMGRNIITILSALLIFWTIINVPTIAKGVKESFDNARNSVLAYFGYQPYYMRLYDPETKTYSIPKKYNRFKK